MNRKAAGSAGVGIGLMIMLVFLTIPMLILGGASVFFAKGTGSCGDSSNQQAQQPTGSKQANAIPADYLKWYKKVGLQYNIPWTTLAGIGTEESQNGQTKLPGVHSGMNSFGAAGPMQIGVSGASTNTWGGPPIHPASQNFGGVATDEDGDGIDNVYDPADAIAGAAKYLNAHGFAHNPSGAIFAYNHAGWYVADVQRFAAGYAAGGFTVSKTNPTPAASASCGNAVLDALTSPNAVAATAIRYAQDQLDKPYLFGGTGPDSFDCSGLVMMAYRAAGINIPRTADEQYHWGPAVAASAVSPGDLVFFAGADGTAAHPGHVGLVIGKNKMIEAYATGFPLRISAFGDKNAAPDEQKVVGFTRPWAHSGLHLSPSQRATPTPAASQSGTGPQTPATSGAPSGTPSHSTQPTTSAPQSTVPNAHNPSTVAPGTTP